MATFYDFIKKLEKEGKISKKNQLMLYCMWQISYEAINQSYHLASHLNSALNLGNNEELRNTLKDSGKEGFVRIVERTIKVMKDSFVSLELSGDDISQGEESLNEALILYTKEDYQCISGFVKVG